MIGVGATGNIKNRYQLIGRLLYLATGKYTLGIAVKQQGQHHFGGIGSTATSFVRPFYFTGIQLLDNFYHKACQAISIQPPFHITGQVDSRSPINFDKFVADASSPSQFCIIYI